MGITGVFGKVKSYIKSIVGKDISTGISKTAHFTSSLMPKSAASIGSVVSKVLGVKEEVGDKLEISTKAETETPVQQPIRSNNNEAATVTTQNQVLAAGRRGTVTNPVTTSVNKKQNSDGVTEEELNKIRIELREKCIESGINFGQLAIGMAALTGRTFREFSHMDRGLQKLLFTYVIQSIDNVNKVNLPDVNKLDAVVTDAALMYHFVTHDKTGKAIDIENITPEELKARREVFNEQLRKRREEKEAEIAKLPESERAAAREALKEELAGYRQHIFEELRQRIPFESALEMILIVSVKNLGKAAQELMESYPIEIREKIANTLQTPESFKEYLKTVKGECDELTADELNAITQFNKIFGTYKTKDNLEAYEASFQESRRSGEFSEDIYKATEMGIGEAAYANINMTSAEKESFISSWINSNNDLLTDADFARVEESASKYIKEIIEKNPEVKDKFSYVQKSIKEIVEKTLNRIFDEKKSNTSNKDNANKELNKLLNNPSVKINNLHRDVLTYAQQYIRIQAKKFETPAIKKCTEQIERALVQGIITEQQAIKNLDNSEHKFIKMCIQNSTLASKYDRRIDFYIKSEKDIEKLKDLAKVAPHEMVIRIVTNMRGDKQELADKLIKNKEVDFNTKVLLNKYTQECAA